MQNCITNQNEIVFENATDVALPRLGSCVEKRRKTLFEHGERRISMNAKLLHAHGLVGDVAFFVDVLFDERRQLIADQSPQRHDEELLMNGTSHQLKQQSVLKFDIQLLYYRNKINHTMCISMQAMLYILLNQI